jgi:mRNA interferase MazF
MLLENAFRRGDIALALFPNSDLRSAKVRPVLVVQANELNTDLPQLVVAMITSRQFRANHPSRVLVEVDSQTWEDSGLLTDSVIMTDNLATVRTEVIRRIIGQVEMSAVDSALRKTLAL